MNLANPVKSKVVTVLLVGFVAVGIFASGWFGAKFFYRNPPELTSLQIVSFGPSAVHRDEGFNIQPDGASAIWVNISRPADARAQIVLAGRPLVSVLTSTTITAKVPPELYSKSGSFNLKIVEPSGVSEPVTWEVK